MPVSARTVPVQIAFQSNPARYSFAGNTRLINAYAEQQGNDAKAPLAVLPCPGMVPCCTVTTTPNRGNIFLDDLQCGYVVHASGVFKYTLASSSPFALTATRIGTLPGIDQVRMSRNQASPPQISIHCAGGEFYIQADTVKQINTTAFTTGTPVTTEDVSAYTLYGLPTGQFFFSSVEDATTVDPLDFATAEQYADKLTRIKANGSDVLFFSHTSIEPWRVTADLNLPFQLIGGSVSKKGLVAPDAVVECDNTQMFPGEDNIFYRMNGYTPTRISTHGIERFLEGDANRETIQSLPYSFEGHSFACWSSQTYTVSYDAANQLWHERKSYGLKNWRACNAVRAFGKTIVGDTQSGKLFYLDKDTYTEDSGTMIWGMDTPFLHAFQNGGIVDALFIDVATGVGTLLATSQGFDPILMLSWSKDGGKTFQGNRQLHLGASGNTVRIVARRIGRFGDKGIQFRVRISDPVIRSIIEMKANVRPLKK